MQELPALMQYKLEYQEILFENKKLKKNQQKQNQQSPAS